MSNQAQPTGETREHSNHFDPPHQSSISNGHIDRASCTVRTLASVAGLSFEAASVIADAAGRQRGRRFKSHLLIDAAKRAGLKVHKLRFSGKTVRKFVEQYPSGRFYVRKTGHAFTVIDGVVGDRTTMGSIILDAWEFL